MKVIASDVFVEDANVELGLPDGQNVSFIKTQSMEDVVSNPILSLHVPAQKDYVMMKFQLDAMKDGAAIINAAGGVIDEVALIEALDAGKLSFAGLDTFENEPTPAIKVLMNQKNIPNSSYRCCYKRSSR